MTTIPISQNDIFLNISHSISVYTIVAGVCRQFHSLQFKLIWYLWNGRGRRAQFAYECAIFNKKHRFFCKCSVFRTHRTTKLCSVFIDIGNSANKTLYGDRKISCFHLRKPHHPNIFLLCLAEWELQFIDFIKYPNLLHLLYLFYVW